MAEPLQVTQVVTSTPDSSGSTKRSGVPASEFKKRQDQFTANDTKEKELLTQESKRKQQALAEDAKTRQKYWLDQQAADKQHALEQKARKEEIKQAMAESEMIRRELKDARIDPNSLWNSRTEGQKVMIGIGIALAGVGRGKTDASNSALEILDGAIDRDIKAQESNLTKKSQDYLRSNTYLGQLENQYKNADEAHLQYRKTQYENLIQRLLVDQSLRAPKEEKAKLAQKLLEKKKQLEIDTFNLLREKYGTKESRWSQQGTRTVMSVPGAGGHGGAGTQKKIPPDNVTNPIDARARVISLTQDMTDRLTEARQAFAKGDTIAGNAALNQFLSSASAAAAVMGRTFSNEAQALPEFARFRRMLGITGDADKDSSLFGGILNKFRLAWSSYEGTLDKMLSMTIKRARREAGQYLKFKENYYQGITDYSREAYPQLFDPEPQQQQQQQGSAPPGPPVEGAKPRAR